jgi:hypothetical protein
MLHLFWVHFLLMFLMRRDTTLIKNMIGESDLPYLMCLPIILHHHTPHHLLLLQVLLLAFILQRRCGVTTWLESKGVMTYSLPFSNNWRIT